MGLRNLLMGFVLGAVMATVGCATTFGYRHYGMDLTGGCDATLRGPKPEQDESIDKCKSMASNKSACTVMFTDDFYRMKQSYETCQLNLKKCEAGR